LHDLALAGRARGWWTAVPLVGAGAPEDEYLALEAEAVSDGEWEAQVVPGLLQTDEYARRGHPKWAPTFIQPETVQRRLALRMARRPC
jgi:hypothetical protein